MDYNYAPYLNPHKECKESNIINCNNFVYRSENSVYLKSGLN